MLTDVCSATEWTSGIQRRRGLIPHLTTTRVNHLGILYRLRSDGVGISVLFVLPQFLTTRSQYVVVDGMRSERVELVSGVPQGSVLGPLLFLQNTSELFNILENDLFGYADDSTLIAVVLIPGSRISIAQSLD
ncbi:hypothetical protein Pcinc_002164 [Petrolisthes cinctipes]|uniref:Reverse transcriptase domain-containing protein n=1 Tax=Petrolisthes cinctipes TaxID=88211 RepID=A0AAE1GLI8_PETCI|nr:hypothetical protein Pcinc_002164 [Petrolisthes cinctipes]